MDLKKQAMKHKTDDAADARATKRGAEKDQWKIKFSWLPNEMHAAIIERSSVQTLKALLQTTKWASYIDENIGEMKLEDKKNIRVLFHPTEPELTIYHSRAGLSQSITQKFTIEREPNSGAITGIRDENQRLLNTLMDTFCKFVFASKLEFDLRNVRGLQELTALFPPHWFDRVKDLSLIFEQDHSEDVGRLLEKCKALQSLKLFNSNTKPIEGNSFNTIFRNIGLPEKLRYLAKTYEGTAKADGLETISSKLEQASKHEIHLIADLPYEQSVVIAFLQKVKTIVKELVIEINKVAGSHSELEKCLDRIALKYIYSKQPFHHKYVINYEDTVITVLIGQYFEFSS